MPQLPQLSELRKHSFYQPKLAEVSKGREETLVTDHRALLTPSQMVEAKFWATLSAVHRHWREPEESHRG